jgi:hypothetical protein
MGSYPVRAGDSFLLPSWSWRLIFIAQLELDVRLVNRSIKAYILTIAFYASNLSLVSLDK